MRRAITHGRLLGQTKPFLSEMVFAVHDLMQDAYPELKESADRVSKAVLAEEKRFSSTMELGLAKLEEDIAPLIAAREEARASRKAQEPVPLEKRKWSDVDLALSPVYDGRKAFKLYDTYGLPRDFIEDACRDQAITLDESGFEIAMAGQRERARASWRGAVKQTANPAYQNLPTSDL